MNAFDRREDAAAVAARVEIAQLLPDANQPRQAASQ